MTYHTHSKQDFRRRLLAAEPENPALRAEYERRIHAMFEVPLSRPKRIWFTTLTVFAAVCGVGAIILVTTERGLPPAARVALVAGAAFAASWVFFLTRIVARGTFRRRVDAPTAAGMGFAFSLIMCVIFAVAGMAAEQVILMGMLFLLPAGLILLRTVIEQSEMRTQERLVELEYKIALLTEKLGGDDDLLGTGVR